MALAGGEGRLPYDVQCTFFNKILLTQGITRFFFLSVGSFNEFSTSS